MRNLDNSRQAVESPKNWNSMGYICLKNTFLQLKHYIQRIYLTLLPTTCVKIHQIPYMCHFWNHKSFFTTQLVCIILVQILYTFDENISSKFFFFRFFTAQVKIHQISHVIFQTKSESFFKVSITLQCHER